MNDKTKTIIILVMGIVFYYLLFFWSDYNYDQVEIEEAYIYQIFEEFFEIFTRGPDEFFAYCLWWLSSFFYFYYLWKKRKDISKFVFKNIKRFYDKV